MSAGGRGHRPRVVAVVSVRMASSRYPGKALHSGGAPMA